MDCGRVQRARANPDVVSRHSIAAHFEGGIPHLTPHRLCWAGTHLSSCASFVAAQSGNLLWKAGKKVENFRYHWVLMSFKDANPRLEGPRGLPEKTSAWSSVKLSDPRVAPILEGFSRDICAKRLTSGMIVKEFLA
ncbi:hypothetical protein D1007_02499 [Hordeum vulgare]|nr:hypothetical protein D1007_02499 [Hordeum vulgare]